MAISAAIEKGVKVAKQAYQHDCAACERNDPALYEQARAHYNLAIDTFSKAAGVEENPRVRGILQKKIALYRERSKIIQDWLGYPATTQIVSETKALNETFVAVHDQSRMASNASRLEDSESDMEELQRRLSLVTIAEEPQVALSDVAGMEAAKNVLLEAGALPEKLSALFRSRRGWKTVLLYGPPGVGKTFLARAIATESSSRFLGFTAAGLMTTRVGQNCESVVRDVFSLAKRSGRAILHIDDVDLLFSTAAGGESESVRMGKARLLKELQSLQDYENDILVVATSRTPWLLEESFLRRMDRRVFVGLPNAKNRAQMLQQMLRHIPHNVTLEELEDIATECEGYTGADMHVLVRDAELEPVRLIMDATHFRRVHVVEEGRTVSKLSPCERSDENAIELRYAGVDEKELHVPPVTCLDLELALDSTRPSISPQTIERHHLFAKGAGQYQHGS